MHPFVQDREAVWFNYKKERYTMKKQTLMILGVLIIGATGFVGFKFAEPKKTSFEVEYQVECATCDVYFRNDKGESQEIVNVNSGWNYKFTAGQGHFAYVAATSDNGKEVKVTITKDGQPVETGTSAEPMVSARAGVIVY